MSNCEPAKWPWDSSELQPLLQSPINVCTLNAHKFECEPLALHIPMKNNMKITVQNTGHGVKVKPDDKDMNLYLTGAFLQDTYVFDHLLYHWGSINSFGSEHFLNNECFAGECHLMLYKKSYCTLEKAMENEDGVIIICFFLELGEKNCKFDKLLNQVSKLNLEPCVSVSNTDALYWFLPDISDLNRSSYFLYPGSLTSPPFTEIVTFILLTKPVCVCEKQIEVFRLLMDDHHKYLCTNRREIQPLKQRPVLTAYNVLWDIIKKEC